MKHYELLFFTFENVHKILLSGKGMVEAKQDIWVGNDGGYVMPKESVIATKLREYFAELIKQYGDEDLIPVYIRRGVFVMDWYMFEDDPDLEAKQLGAIKGATGSAEGALPASFHRQGHHP